MKGSVIDEKLIAGDDGRYYHYAEDELRNSVPNSGDRVRFRIDGDNAKNIFVITDENDDEKPYKSAPNLKSSIGTLKAKDEYKSLAKAKFYGVISGFFPFAIVGFLIFSKMSPKDLLVIFLVLHIFAVIFAYLAIKIVADLARDEWVAGAYIKAVLIFIFFSFIKDFIRLEFFEIAKVIENVIMLTAILGMIYGVFLMIKAFLKLSQITRNGLFKQYIFYYIIGDILYALELPFSGLAFLFACVIYILAWHRTSDVSSRRDSELLVY